MICLACLFLFDIFFGVGPRPGEMDLLHLVYDLILKITLAFMIFQRRPITEARGYEKDIHTGYHPFNLSNVKKKTYFHLSRSVTGKNKKKLENDEGQKSLQEPSRKKGYCRVLSYHDNKNISIANTALEGLEMTEKRKVIEPDRPVRPPKEVPAVLNLPTGRLTLPSIGQATDANHSRKTAGRDDGWVRASALNVRSKQSVDLKVRGMTNEEYPPPPSKIVTKGEYKCDRVAEPSVEILEKSKPTKTMEPAREEKTISNDIPGHSVEKNTSDEVGNQSDELKESLINSNCNEPIIELVNESPVVLRTLNVDENHMVLIV